MNEAEVRELLTLVGTGDIEIDDAVQTLKNGPFKLSHLKDATLDHHRHLRHGLCEVVYGESKTSEQIISISKKLIQKEETILITRLNKEKQEALQLAVPDGRLNAAGRTFMLNANEPKGPESGEPYVALVSAGTSDLPVVEEAKEVCIASEVAFLDIHDVGVAGLHRLLNRLDELSRATAIVVVAGMEGALPSVVAGLVGKPMFAVPTSVGYGASMNGLAALLTMLNSCSAGVSVANIDNGFSGAYAACKVINEVKKAQQQPVPA
ncbi:MAG: nickel pincer cofactor biosynthesis protein LarB [Candidatus Marinimicrobia bacterium]|nr:nickel pincer cofactor biosynthesis protein LarB [Candidatus Neomarinimicrobiota bacterium]